MSQIPVQLFTSEHETRRPAKDVIDGQFPMLSLSNTACEKCCRIVGMELCGDPWKIRPRRVVYWPSASQTEVNVPIHDGPIVFVGHSKALVLMCAYPICSVLCDVKER